MVNHSDEVSGSIVHVMWEKASCPAHANATTYAVYYREELRTGSRGQWSTVNISGGATHHDLQLHCFKEYEIAVAYWDANGALPNKRWKVKTGVGTSQVMEQARHFMNVLMTYVLAQLSPLKYRLIEC